MPSSLTISTSALLSLGLVLSTPYTVADQLSPSSGKPGYLMGGFHILPEIEVAEYYDDNIYATKRAKESDLVSLVTATLEVDSRWQRHYLDLGAGASIGRYLDISAEDYEDFWVKGDGQLDVGDTARIYAGAGYSVNHESRGAKESAQQLIEAPTTYDARTLQIGLDRQIGQAMLKLGTTFEALDYDDVGPLLNDDRDRTAIGFGLRIAFPLAESTSLFAQSILKQRDYDDGVDQFGYERDSDGHNTLLGIIREHHERYSIQAYVGYLVQEYDDDRFERLDEPNYGFDLCWYTPSGSKLTAKLERSSNETTEIGSAGYLYTGLDLQLDRKMVTDLVGYLNYGYGLAEFQDVGREDFTRSVTIGLKYYASPKVMITGSYSRLDNDSNDKNSVLPLDDTYDYARNMLYIALRARLVP
jgi:hypothetical protein